MDYFEAEHIETGEKIIMCEIFTDSGIKYIAPNIHDIYEGRRGVVVFQDNEVWRYYRKT